MKLKLFGALLGAIMLMAAAPAGATTVTGTSTVNDLGPIVPGVVNFGAGAGGTNVAAFGNGKTFFDYIFSFTLNGASQVTFTTGATANGNFNFTDYHAAVFDNSPAGSSLTDANPAPISLTNTTGLLTLGNTNGGTLGTLTLTAGTYYLRLFGLLPGNINSGHALSGISGSLTVAATPIPAALPLFATALGLMGFFGWRRKSTSAAVAAA